MSVSDEAAGSPNAIRIQISNPSLLLIPVCASTFGFVSGLLSAAQKSSLQFLAENAHRQPTTLQGWYFYNKTKNYRVALAAFKGGLKTAARLAVWTGSFVGLKEATTGVTGWGEAESGATSGALIAFAANGLYHLGRRALPKNLLLGASLGALAGGLQDAKAWVATKKREAQAAEIAAG